VETACIVILTRKAVWLRVGTHCVWDLSCWDMTGLDGPAVVVLKNILLIV